MQGTIQREGQPCNLIRQGGQELSSCDQSLEFSALDFL